jgi:hypothetical protein
MMVPGSPLSDLIICHTAFAFCVFKCTFDPVPLPLHPAQTFKLSVFRRIGQRDFCIGVTRDRFRHDQSPAMNLRRPPIPNVNFQLAAPDFEHTAGCFAKCQRLPILCRKGINKLTYLYAFLIGLILREGTSTIISFLGHVRLWIFQIYMQTRVQIYNEPLSHFIKSRTKARPHTIPCISADLSKPDAVFLSMSYNFQREFCFCAKAPLLFRRSSFFVTFWIINPFFRQIEKCVNGYSKPSIGQSLKNCHLAIIDFAKTSQPLARNTYQTLSLFSKAAFINQTVILT